MAKVSKVETTAEQLRRLNLANILKRLKKGRTMTAGDLLMLKESEAAEKTPGVAPLPPISPKTQAAFWRVSHVTIHNWMAKHAEGKMPRVDDIPAMLEWERGLPRGGRGRGSVTFVARCAELRVERGEKPPAPKTDEAWIKYREGAGARDPAGHKEQIKSLEMFRDGYAMKLDDALARQDHAEVDRWNELLIKTTNSIRQNKLAADQLGLDRGDIISFDEMDRIIAAFGYWTMRAIEQHLDALSGKLAALSPGFEKKNVRAVLEPELLSLRFLVPFAKSAKPSGIALPARAVAKLKQTAGDYLEDGERLMREEISKS